MYLLVTPNQIYISAAAVAMLAVVIFLLAVFTKSFNRNKVTVNSPFEAKYAAILESLQQAKDIADVYEVETMAIVLLTRIDILDPKNEMEMNHLDASFAWFTLKFSEAVEYELKFSTHLPTASFTKPITPKL